MWRPNQGSRLIRLAIALALASVVALPTAAFAEGHQLPVGTHDGAEGVQPSTTCYANGWAVDPDDPGRRVPVRISVDGEVIGTFTADEFRQDLLDAGLSDGYSGFWVWLNPWAPLDVELEILVEAWDAETDSWNPVDATPKSLTCGNAPPDGFHDAVEGRVGQEACRAQGWAVDPDDRYARLEVRVKVRGRTIVSGVADRFRDDLLEAGVSPDGYSSFDLDLWGRLEPGKPHQVLVQARDANTGEWSDLNETPRTLRCLVDAPGPPFG